MAHGDGHGGGFGHGGFGHGFGGHGGFHGGGGHGHGNEGSTFDGGHGSSDHGTDHDQMGHAFHGGAFSAQGGGHCHGHGFHYGHLAHALAFMGLTDGTEDGGCCGKRVRLPGIVTTDRSVQALVWPHGHCDVERVAKDLMSKHGFRDIAFIRRDCAPGNKFDKEIKDTTPFDGTIFGNPMPSGYYPGATGHTQQWRCFWQLPRKKHWWDELKVDLGEPVYLVMTGASWFFNEVGDYETRLLLTVISRARLDRGKWVHRKDLIDKHLYCATHVAEELVERLQKCEPSTAAVTQRMVQARAEQVLLEHQEKVRRESQAIQSNLPLDGCSRGDDKPVEGKVPPRIRPIITGLPDPMDFDDKGNLPSK